MNEAELLFTSVLGCDRAQLYLNRDAILSAAHSRSIASALRRRMRGEPMQYILGTTEFMGLEFRVTPAVLVPRPETEIVVEKVIELVKRLMCNGKRIKILDIGTGSGCIAVSLAHFLPYACIDAVDISIQALAVARDNARSHGVQERIRFIQKDVMARHQLSRIPYPVSQYDFVISNPPYVPTGEIRTLQPEVQHEPRLALDGGKDGLDFYRRIMRVAPEYLTAGGWLVMEMGCGQYKMILRLLEESGSFRCKEVVKDYQRIERVVFAQSKGREVAYG
ncbi:MAG: peptide chain release factor N(5)-glutamine methyltransferase [Candidatus Omnitrophica bacterium]|nr:peptide chain release factor N(5)-glutamine methyltransferase [Candidatus Omnitrophota bacterium]